MAEELKPVLWLELDGSATGLPSMTPAKSGTGSGRRTRRCGERYRPFKLKSTGISAHLPAIS